MAAGGFVEGAVLVVFGAGIGVNQSRQWGLLERPGRQAAFVRAGLPILLGATALSSAANLPVVVPGVLLAGFGVLVVAAVVLGWRQIRRRRDDPLGPP